ncbi:MAG: T9SS type A sorting domain-containing protein [Sphingobacteriales bacterium]|nr:T9SS type A sorting domain-containing protein [Sphingobacteriales bacterium]
MSFKLQSLDSSFPRMTTWIVDYATGASPAVFTPVTTSPATLVTGNKVFSNTDVTVDFGTALDNISDVVYIRVATVKKSTCSGNRASTAIDDWSLSWSGISAINDLFSRNSYVKLVGNTPDKLSLLFNKSINNKIQLQLTSLNGQVVYTRAIGKVTEGQTESIPMAALPKGVYFVSILSKDGNFGTKISH